VKKKNSLAVKKHLIIPKCMCIPAL